MRNLLNINALHEDNQCDVALLLCSNCNILHKFCKKMSNGYVAWGVSLLISLSIIIKNLIFKY